MREKVGLDKKLWIILKNHNCDGEHYILGNPHTFAGRIMGYCAKKEVSIYFSLNEIEKSSIETEYWIKGYLAGNEPKPPIDKDDMTAFGSEAYTFWQKSAALFHKTGYWSHSERMCELRNETLLNSYPKDICKKCLDKK